MEKLEPTGAQTINMVSCEECHSYPGSAMCQMQTESINGLERTFCNDCHAGSIMLDSSMSNGTMYHDASELSNGVYYPVTSNKHANGAVDLDFNQCNSCHGYPPVSEEAIEDSTGHMFHVVVYNMKCVDCHFTTIRHDPYYVYIQTWKRIPGGDSIPLVNPTEHLDKTINVSLRVREQVNNETLNIWDPITKSCTNIICHGSPGDEYYYESFWEHKGR